MLTRHARFRHLCRGRASQIVAAELDLECASNAGGCLFRPIAHRRAGADEYIVSDGRSAPAQNGASTFSAAESS